MKNELRSFKRVMVIDDTQIDRYIAEMTIKKYLFAEDVITLESAIEAIDYLTSIVNIEDELPEIIFLDINMPDMNGFEFLEKYRELPEAIRQHCIIMMLTTSLDVKDKEKAENSPFVAQFINKPLNKERLESILQNFAEGKREADASRK